MGAGWTDDRVEHCKKLWEAGLSCSQIAGELGGGLTRNAVIGKVHRSGWSGRAKIPPPGGKQKRVRRVNPHATSTFQSFRRGAPPAPSAARETVPGSDMPPGPVFFAEPEVGRALFAELDDGDCHWPMGAMFCGEATGSNRESYCPAHCMRSYGALHRVNPEKKIVRRLPALAYTPRNHTNF